MKCSCGCNTKIKFEWDDDGIIFVDVKDSGQGNKKWIGVTLYGNELERFNKFIRSLL